MVCVGDRYNGAGNEMRSVTLYLMSDSYLGMDQQYTVGLGPQGRGVGAGAAAAPNAAAQLKYSGNAPTSDVQRGGARAGNGRSDTLSGSAYGNGAQAASVAATAHIGGSGSAHSMSTSAAASVPAVASTPATTSDGSAGGRRTSVDELCVICWERPRECGLLHGGTLHNAVCRACAQHVALGSPCPMCRQPVESLVDSQGCEMHVSLS